MIPNNKHYLVKYFKINDAINCEIDSNKVFIISNERITKKGKVGRYFSVFPTFKFFLKRRTKFDHCHELLIDHINNTPDISGRLVFDFDVKFENAPNIPQDFNKQIEDTILEVIERYFNNVNQEKLVFVWSTSKNPNKFSKHLTVKNLCFDNWINMSKIFYELFCLVWDENEPWIKSNKLIDSQIVKKNGSLRMVGSSKINGYLLEFDNPKHKLTDSLIRIYSRTQKRREQIINMDNLNEGVLGNVIYQDQESTPKKIITEPTPFPCSDEKYFNLDVYIKSFEILWKITNSFKIGKIQGKLMTLVRTKPGKCIMSGKFHENENAYLMINKSLMEYTIRFSCFRYCHKNKYLFIASMTIDNYVIMLNPIFEIHDKEKISSPKKCLID